MTYRGIVTNGVIVLQNGGGLADGTVVEVKPLDLDARSRQLKELFKTTQALPEANMVSEEEIAAELAAYRAGR